MPSGLSADEEAKLEQVLRKTFAEFDTDGSGKVDEQEISAMLQNMGMIPTTEQVKKLIEEADQEGADGVKDGEIDFDEFFAAVKKDAGGGGGFAELVNRKRNQGPAAKWDKEKNSASAQIDANDARKLTKAGDGWSMAVLDRLFNTTSSGYDAFDCLLKFDNVSGAVSVGVASQNYNPSNESTDFIENPKAIGSNCKGDVFVKGKPAGVSTKMCEIQSGDTFQLSLRMATTSATFTVLGPNEKIKASVQVDVQLPQATLVVGFGPQTGDKPFDVTLLGQSCEKTPQSDLAVNETESNEKKNARDNSEAAAAMSL